MRKIKIIFFIFAVGFQIADLKDAHKCPKIALNFSDDQIYHPKVDR